MGRPKKDGLERDEVAVVDEMPMAKDEKLKACPKCGEDKAQAYQDIHGHWRCACTACGFWDCLVFNSADEAKKSWQLAGGPSPEGHDSN
jgi:capsule polysaccharide modification protein KpsS